MIGDPILDATAHDLEGLQGRWEQIGFEADGRPDSLDEFGSTGTVTTIDGYRFSVRTTEGGLLLEGTFMLDASAYPKAITWMDSMGTDAGRCLPASYELDGDRFVFIAADADATRPTVFHTRSGQVMRTFVRKR